MAVGIGYNYHYSWSSAALRAEVEAYVRDYTPPAMLFLDTFGDAAQEFLRLARTYPKTVWIYRKYINGDNQQNYLSPQQWVRENIALQDCPVNAFAALNNEPNPTASLEWHLQVMQLARLNRIRVSVGGYSVGVPEVSDLPKFRNILLYMKANPKWFILDLHEYARAMVFVDWNKDAIQPHQWPEKVPATHTLYTMGRFREWVKYARSIGYTNLRIVIGEWGFDRVHSVPANVYGDTGGLLHCFGTWGQWGVGNVEEYSAAQLRAAWRAIYKDYPEIIGVCYFQWSDNPGNWGEFNAHFAPTFREKLKYGFDKVTTVATKPTGYAPGTYTLDISSGYINFRETPNGKDIGDIRKGDTVVVTQNTEVSDQIGGYFWQKVNYGKEGWIALMPSYTLKAQVSREQIVAQIREHLAAINLLLDKLAVA